MKFPIGAMSVGDVLDRGLKLLLARLPAYYLINLIVLSPLIILQAFILPSVIGSDSPGLPADYIQQAFRSLDDHDLAIGPTFDGGYYLAGLRRRVPEIFYGIEWSTERVLEQTTGKRTVVPHQILPHQAAGVRQAIWEKIGFRKQQQARRLNAVGAQDDYFGALKYFAEKGVAM